MSAQRVQKHKSLHLPPVPSLWKLLGPSFILLGLALGSGELLLWPYLTANYGLGLLWGALLGISLQYVLNTEVMRYTLAWGESVFVGWRKLSVVLPVWFIASTFIPWSLPGFSSASSQIFHTFLPFIPQPVITVSLLLLVGFALTAGKTVYKTLEFFEKAIIFLAVPFIFVLVFLLSHPQDWWEALRGLMAQGGEAGSMWWFFPPGIALGSFLGAFAYSGGGGNLNLSQSHYVKEKGLGMGAYAPKLTSLLAGGVQAVRVEGQLFTPTPSNQHLWRKWWGLVTLEHLIVFWGMGLLTIVMLAVLAKSLVYGADVQSGLSFVFYEAEVIGQRTWPLLGNIFLFLVGVMLFSTQVIVLESSSRTISENVLLMFYKPGRKFNLSWAFFAALWGQIILGIVLLFSGFHEPRFVLTLAAALNAAAMMVAFPLLYWLNTTKLDKKQQPGMIRKALMIIAFLFFLFFVVITVRDFRI